MIRTTKPNVLWFDGRRTHLMPAGSEFRADDALEARWVAEGVAEYVDAPEPQPVNDEPLPEAPAPEPPTEPEGGETDLADMTRAELAELAESLGIKPGKLTKAKLIAVIAEAEQAPDLSAAEVE
ncbi:hypothetical protein H6A18_09355 [Collinsella tanakaei]|uniref:Rho termination factor N-terminal domain-containing protein n=1 Tax=Collinsella tanakaei TaxID=626935 RepID=UPI0019582088|nr:Rho termination factor N-terminal domain-containing protein [Collinsella tanakaei]MBM6756707.1 hypothetical protein [Collinsella tanakaei]